MKTIFRSLVLVFICVNIISAQWTQTNGPQGANIEHLAYSGNIIYASTDALLYRSYNNGTNWELLNPPTKGPAQVFARGSIVYLEDGYDGGLLRSDDEGDTWNEVAGFENNLINSVVFYNDTTYINIDDGVFISHNDGISFDYYPAPSDLNLLTELVFAGNYLFSSSIKSAVYSLVRSSDFGRSWIRIDSGGLPVNRAYAHNMVYGNNTLFASVIYSGIYKSTDFGVHWSCILPDTNRYYAVLRYRNGKLYAAFQDTIFVTSNSGINWSSISQIDPEHSINDFILKGNRMFAGLYFPGVYRSNDGGNSWQFTSNGMKELDVNGFVASGNYLYASHNGCGLYRTTNGNNWQRRMGNLPHDYVQSVAKDNNTIYVGCGVYPTPQYGLYRTTNFGLNWNNVYSDSYLSIMVINAQGSDIMFGTSRHGIYRTTNDGLNWNLISYSPLGINSILRTDGWLFYSTHNTHSAPSGSIARSSDNGLNWDYVPVPTKPRPYPAFLEYNNGFMYAIAQGKLFKSDNYGTNWIQYAAPFADSLFNSIYSYNGILYCGTEESSNGNYYVRYSYDNGNTWFVAGESLPAEVNHFCVKGNYLFAALYNYGVWRLPLSYVIPVKTPSITVPDKFYLHQNYPNPFNPVTVIQYDIPQNCNVKIVIYDILGRGIKTLVNEKKTAGVYQVQFDGSNLSSGTYFYRMEAGNYIDTKKLMLVK